MSTEGQDSHAVRATDAQADHVHEHDEAATAETAEDVEALIATRMRELQELQAQAANLQRVRDSVMALMALQEAGELPDEEGNEPSTASAAAAGDDTPVNAQRALMQMLALMASMGLTGDDQGGDGEDVAPTAAPADAAVVQAEEESLAEAQAEVEQLRSLLAERHAQVESLRQQTAMMDMLLANLEAGTAAQEAAVMQVTAVTESKEDSAQHSSSAGAGAVAAAPPAAADEDAVGEEQEEEMTEEDAAQLQALTQQLAAVMAEVSALNAQAEQLTQVRDSLQGTLAQAQQVPELPAAPAVAEPEAATEEDDAAVQVMMRERDALLQRLQALMAMQAVLESLPAADDGDDEQGEADAELQRGHVERIDDVTPMPASASTVAQPAAVAAVVHAPAPSAPVPVPIPAATAAPAAVTAASAAAAQDDDAEADADEAQDPEAVLAAMQERLAMLQRLEQLLKLQAFLEATLATEAQGQGSVEQLEDAASAPAPAAPAAVAKSAPAPAPASVVSASAVPVSAAAATRTASSGSVSAPSAASLDRAVSAASSEPVDMRAFLSAVGFVMEGGHLPSGAVPQLRKGASYDADDEDSVTAEPVIAHPSGSTRAAREARLRQEVDDVRALPEVTTKVPTLPGTASAPTHAVAADADAAGAQADDVDLADLQARIAHMHALADEVRVLQAQQRVLLSTAALQHATASQPAPTASLAAGDDVDEGQEEEDAGVDIADVARVRGRLDALRAFLAGFDLHAVLGDVLQTISSGAEATDAMSIASTVSMPDTLGDLAAEEELALQQILGASARRAASQALIACLPDLEESLEREDSTITLRDIASTPTFAAVFRNELVAAVFGDIPAAAAILSVASERVPAQPREAQWVEVTAPPPADADVYAGSLRRTVGSRPAAAAVPAPMQAAPPHASVNESFHSTLSAATTRSNTASVQHAAAEYAASMRATRGDATQARRSVQPAMTASDKPRRSTSGTRVSAAAMASSSHPRTGGSSLRGKLPPQVPPPTSRARSRSKDGKALGAAFVRASPTPTSRAVDARSGVRIVSHGNHPPAAPASRSAHAVGTAATVRGATVTVLPPAEVLPRMEMLPGRGVPAYTSAMAIRNPPVEVQPSVHARTPPRRATSRGQPRERHGTPVWLRSALENGAPASSGRATLPPSPPHQQVQQRRASPTRTPSSASRGRSSEPRWNSSTRIDRDKSPPPRVTTPGRVGSAVSRPRVMEEAVEMQLPSDEQTVDAVAAQIIKSRQRLLAVTAPDTPAPRATAKHVPTLRVPEDDGGGIPSEQAQVARVEAAIATARERIAAASVRAPSPRGSGFAQRETARPALHVLPRHETAADVSAHEQREAQHVDASIIKARERIALVTGDAASSPRGPGFQRQPAPTAAAGDRPLLAVEEDSSTSDDLNASGAWNNVVRTIERARERIAAATSRLDSSDAFPSPSNKPQRDAAQLATPDKHSALAAVEASLRALAATSPELAQRIVLARALLDAEATQVAGTATSATVASHSGGHEVRNEPFDYAESVADSAPLLPESHDNSRIGRRGEAASVDTDEQHVSYADLEVQGRVTAMSSRSGGGASLAVKSVEGALSPAEYDYEEVVSVRAAGDAPSRAEPPPVAAAPPPAVPPAVALFHSRSGSILAASDASDGSISGWTHSAAGDDDEDDEDDVDGRAYDAVHSAATGLTHAGSSSSAAVSGPHPAGHSSRGAASAADARYSSPARANAARKQARIVRELKKRRAVALSVVLRAAGTWMEPNMSDGALPGSAVSSVGTMLSPEELTALVIEIGSVLTGVPPRMVATISAPGAQLPDDADAGMDGDEEERSGAPPRRRKRSTWRRGAARLALHTWQSSFPSFHAALLSYVGVDGAVANTQKAFLRDARTALGDWWTLVTALASSRAYSGSSGGRRQAGEARRVDAAPSQVAAPAPAPAASLFPMRMVQRADGSWAVESSGPAATAAAAGSSEDIRFHSSEGERDGAGGWMMEDAEGAMEITGMEAPAGGEGDVTSSTIGQLERADMLGDAAAASAAQPERVVVRAPAPPAGLGEQDLSQTARLNAFAMAELMAALPVRATAARAAATKDDDDIWAEEQ